MTTQTTQSTKETKKPLSPWFPFLMILAIIAFIIWVVYNLENKVNSAEDENQKLVKFITTKDVEIQKLQKENQKLKALNSEDDGVLFTVTKLDIMEDMVQYTQLSDKQKKIIIETIFEESKKYDINPLVLYSLIHAESSFRFWIEHSQVTIAGKKMRAVGLGGVMWYWHGEKLTKADIASNRSELFDPVTNIRATAFIFDDYMKQPMHKDATNLHHSAMLRYFGGSYKSYIQSIEKKMMIVLGRKIYQP